MPHTTVTYNQLQIYLGMRHPLKTGPMRVHVSMQVYFGFGIFKRVRLLDNLCHG